MKMMQIAQVIAASVAFFDKGGNPAQVDGLPKWGVSDESIASLEVAADGMSAKATALKSGSFKFVGTADADLGEGVKQLAFESEEIVVLAGEAVRVQLTLGEPVDAPVVEEPAPEPAPEEPAPVEEAKSAAKKKK